MKCTKRKLHLNEVDEIGKVTKLALSNLLRIDKLDETGKGYKMDNF